MSDVIRVFVEKRKGFDVEASQMKWDFGESSATSDFRIG